MNRSLLLVAVLGVVGYVLITRGQLAGVQNPGANPTGGQNAAGVPTDQSGSLEAAFAALFNFGTEIVKAVAPKNN